MFDQPTAAAACRLCGVPLSDDELRLDELCPRCAELSRSSTSSYGLPFEATPSPVSSDPNHPHWGPIAGVSTWIGSVLAIIMLPSIAVIAYYLIQLARGAHLPGLASQNELRDWLMSPRLLLIQVLSTVVAHVITIAICWAVVTKLGTRPFWASLGWNWAGRTWWYWVVFSGCVILGIEIASILLLRVLPQSEDNTFSQLLKSSREVRITIALFATFSAPIVEEVVYRGVLFAGIRKRFGAAAAVISVTLLFPAVHLLQYQGAWVTMAALLLLSLILTVVRERTGSILPCVMIHFVNNAFSSVLILLNKSS